MRKNLLIGILSFALGATLIYLIDSKMMVDSKNKANQILGNSQKLWDVQTKIEENNNSTFLLLIKCIKDQCDIENSTKQAMLNKDQNDQLYKQKDELSKKINQLIIEFENLRP